MAGPLLDPIAVLRRASAVPGCKSIPIPNSPLICSFIVGLGNDENQQHILQQQQRRSAADPDRLARISVFTDTGTVSIGRILHGNLRQVFRRNVTSLDVIEDLLRDPPQLTKIDPSLVGSGSSRMTAKTQLDLAQVGVAILEGERDKLDAHVHALLEQQLAQKQKQQETSVAAAVSPKTRSPTAAAAATEQHHHQQQQQQLPMFGSPKQPPTSPRGVESSTAAAAASTPGGNGAGGGLSGMEFQFSLPPDAMKDVDRCLTDIHSMGKLVRKVATNGRGTVFLYGNGGVAYTPQIPKALYHRLSQLRHSSYEHRPAYVSLGSRDRYYCSFHDGSYAFKGPKGLDRELKKAKKQPVSVAFGSTYDTFCVVFSDGSWKCGGRAIPQELEERLGDRRDVYTANLGPDGEWFLKLRSKQMWWGGIHSELKAAIEDLLESGHQLHFLDFGDDGSYFVSYD